MRASMWPGKPLSCLLVVAILGAVIPYRPARAELVATESVITPASAPERDRARLRALLDRQDVQAQLQAYGVSAEEAATRVDALTDREVVLIADRLDEVPAGAGGDAFAAAVLLLFFGETIAIVLVVALVVVGIGMLIWGVKNAAKHKSNSSAPPTSAPTPSSAAEASPPPAVAADPPATSSAAARPAGPEAELKALIGSWTGTLAGPPRSGSDSGIRHDVTLRIFEEGGDVRWESSRRSRGWEVSRGSGTVALSEDGIVLSGRRWDPESSSATTIPVAFTVTRWGRMLEGTILGADNVVYTIVLTPSW